MNNYGKELILDLHNCNPQKFNRKELKRYFKELCILIDMHPTKLVWWDDVGVAENEKQTQAHTKGTSAVQFIITSSIVIHTLDILKSVYINIFSCKDFSAEVALKFTKDFFEGEVVNFLMVDRK